MFNDIREGEAEADDRKEWSEPADDVCDFQRMVVQGNQIKRCRDEHVAEIISFAFVGEGGECEEKQRDETDDDGRRQPCGERHNVHTLVDTQANFRVEEAGETKRENGPSLYEGDRPAVVASRKS